MKLIPLGVAGAYTAPGEASPGYLLEKDNQYILIDAGPGITGRLAKFVNYAKLKAIIVSHLHFDHMLDLLPLSYALHIKGKSVPLYFPFETKNMLIGTYRANDIMKFLESFIMFDSKGSIQVGPFKVTFLPVKHRIATVGVRVETEDGALAYSGDSAYCENLIKLARDADIFLSEATYLEKDKHRTEEGHMAAKEAALVAKEANVKKLLLTHIWFEYDKVDSLKEAKRVFKKVEIAQEMKIYNIVPY
ncbi:MAG: MBL fold metallo-hydrolase [Candidatus Odinarchaeota archaeon]|nr:MBL fold metallo-hydrolase [Candidatus Odinarchaeota archaeon]